MTDQTAIEITDADSDAAELFEYLQGHIHQDKVHDAARRAVLSDATGGFFDEHLFRETLRAAANAIAAWNKRASPAPEPVAAMEPVAWRPIGTAPKDGTWVLVVCAGYIPDVAYFHKDGGWAAGEEEDPRPDEKWGLTHWMPLPPAPGEQT